VRSLDKFKGRTRYQFHPRDVTPFRYIANFALCLVRVRVKHSIKRQKEKIAGAHLPRPVSSPPGGGQRGPTSI